MNILILGGGGREHAIAWRLSRDPSSTRILVWPGNDGVSGDKLERVDWPFDREKLARLVTEARIDLVVPGAEKYLYDGVADWCRDLGVTCFGPGAAAATLEKSKLFAKTLMCEAGVPTSPFQDLTGALARGVSDALPLVQAFRKPVIKISGPSLGKGVFVCGSVAEAADVLRKLAEDPQPGMEDGLLVEEAVSGKEVSMFYACAGTDFTYLGSAQDHKRVFDGDAGPNTGGMGAVAPVPWVSEAFIRDVVDRFVRPTLEIMANRGTPFSGVLFLGLMVGPEGANLLEYNVRFGDPETQTILPLVDGDLSDFLLRFSRGEVTRGLSIHPGAAVHVVKAAKGYPGVFGAPIEKGQPITGREIADPAGKLFFAGVKRGPEGLVTNGGRVLGVTAWAPSVAEAIRDCYARLGDVCFPGEHFRRDIGRNL